MTEPGIDHPGVAADPGRSSKRAEFAESGQTNAVPPPLEAWEELVASADCDVEDWDADRESELVGLLQQGGDPRVVELALPLLNDAAADRRRVSAWLLGQFGYPDGRPFGEVVAPALATAARSETDDETRAELVTALGFAQDRAWAAELSRYADDPYPPARVAVARALPSIFAGGDLDEAAVATLIQLSRDDDPDARDWATFSLGTQSTLDTPEIREALAARLDDPAGDTRFEATVGLARRGDTRITQRLVQRLSAPSSAIYRMDMEAAAALGDPALMPILEQLEHAWAGDPDDAHLHALYLAMERCRPEAPVRAAELERQMLNAVNRDLASTGWTLGLVGGFPHTLVTLTQPDGTPDDAAFSRAMLWEEEALVDFDPHLAAASWVISVSAWAQTAGLS